MDPLLLGLVVGVSTVVMLFSGIPIAFGLCFISVVFLVIAEGFSILNVFAETFYAGLNSFVLLSIPMFILMGMAVANSPAGKDLYTGLDRWLWRLPGGLVVSNIGACSIFAALSGSSPATCAAIGTMGIPEMRKRGYSARLATGCIAAGGTLGVLIPPSIMLVVMGPIMEIPVIDLFAAAIFPGILLATLYAAYTTIRCMMNPELGPPLPEEMRATSMRKVWIEFFLGLVPPAALVFAALGSILLGFATPTEAAGCGAMGALLLSLAYKKLTLAKLQEALVKTLEITALIMVLVAASNFFGAVFARLGTPTLLTEFLLGLEMNKHLILGIIMVMIFLLGWPLEWVPIVMIIIPIILPLVEALGFNLTWFAILVAVNLQTAWLSPPVALSAYFLKGVVPEWDLKDIYLGMMQFMVLQIIGLIIIIIFPKIVLWLPSVLYGQ